MSRTRQFVKTSAIYFLGSVLIKLISFFLLPLYTSLISTVDYGLYDLYNSFLSVIVPVCCFELWNGVLRFALDFDDSQSRDKVISNSMLILPGSLILYTAAFLTVDYFIHFRYFWLVGSVGISTILCDMYQYTARGYGKNHHYVISGVVGSFASIASNVALILVAGMRLKALLISAIVGYAVQIVYLETAVGVVRKIKLEYFDRELIQRLILYCAPLSLNSAAFWFLSGFDRVVIKNYLGAQENGIYAVANKFTTVISLVVSIFLMAWQETAYSLGKEDKRCNYYSAGINHFNRILGFFAVLLIPATKVFFPFFVKGDFVSALYILPMYYVASLASALSEFLGSVFGAEKKTGALFYSTVAAALIDVLIMLLLVPVIKLHAVPLAILCGFSVNTAIRLKLLKKTAKIRLELKTVVQFFVLLVISVWLFYESTRLINLIWCIVLGMIVLYLSKDILRVLLCAIKGRLGSNGMTG